MKRFQILSGVALLTSAVAVPGQTPTPALPITPAVPAIIAAVEEVKHGDAVPESKASRPPAAPTADAKAQPKDSPRLQKLRQLKFDRRPSAILKAWANPPKVQLPLKDFAGPPAPDQKNELDVEIEKYQRSVTLGQWAAVKTYLKGLPEPEGQAAYKQLLQSLATPPMGPNRGLSEDGGTPQPMMGNQGLAMQYMEKNAFTAEDVIGLATAAPSSLEKEAINYLGGILRQAFSSGTVVEVAVDRLKAEVAKSREQAALTNREAARLLIAAGSAAEMGAFLPSLEQATTDKDREGLNLIARNALALHVKEKKPTHLERAWAATQAALLVIDDSKEEKEDSLKRAVELASTIREELGQVWLDQSFTVAPERGMDILATLGAGVSQGLMANLMNSGPRLKALQLQKTAVDALLKAAPARANEWRATLSLLAGNWLKEAELAYQYGKSTSLMQRISRDSFGNIYYFDEDYNPYGNLRQQNQPANISIGEVLAARPDDAWLALVSDDLKPKLSAVYAQLYLKVNEETKAFPYIERLAQSHPQKAKELVSEFLRVWTQNHDPNGQRQNTNRYMFMYGFERRAEGIPLTRSKQERNLVELADWVTRLRRLPLGEPDEELLAKAFTTSHSSAEVYRLELIETVFGPVGNIKPKTLSGLAQQMRENLAGVWKQPKTQQEKKTNRKPKDIQAEVLRGYALARTMVAGAKAKFPADWSLQLAEAALMHDETIYRQEVAKSPKYAAQHDEAMAAFARAAALYAAAVRDLSEDEQSTKVYEQWFYASLGACDLEHVDERKQPDLRQPALIREAIKTLPGELAEKHLGRFANTLFTRMSAVSPAAKFRYLQGGFDIVGDHKQAYEARKIFEYYRDLVTEIKLETAIDGPDVVGHGKPFGVFVNLRHTREIERESGGFSRYLQNQNSMYFSYNYGRPTADYRDKFHAGVNEALKEHFEVLSVTFQHENVNSKAASTYGWRTTPYAYLLLKARGPHVDKLPPVRIDMDFLDMSGYVVIPVESPAIPLDAKPDQGAPRPARRVQVTQILDERQADKGKLVLEVKANALGLVPELDQLIKLDAPGFERAKVDDPGISVAKFDQDSDDPAVVSERNWLITFQAKPDLAERPKTFRFGERILDEAELAYQRYHDADLVTALPEVPLEREYAQPSRAWMWWTAAGLGVFIGLMVAAVVVRRRRKPVAATGWTLPDDLTPFSVLSLLQTIEQKNGLDDSQKGHLRQSIVSLERQYFAKDATGESNLRDVAEFWVKQAKHAR